MKYKFPMPSFQVGPRIMRWAEELREVWDSLSHDVEVVNGKDGKDGKDGETEWKYTKLALTDGGTVEILPEMLPGTVDISGAYTTIYALTYIKLPKNVPGAYLQLLVKQATLYAAPGQIYVVDQSMNTVIGVPARSGGGHGKWYSITCTDVHDGARWVYGQVAEW